MIDILREYAPFYVTRYRRQAVPQVQSVLAKISLCRTKALGGHKYRCSNCQYEIPMYNSCGDRHCPGCRGARRANWLDKTAKLLLPGVDYFQVVFTLPDVVSHLALSHRPVVFRLLFRTAWRALRERLENEQRFQPAALMVLHT